MRQGQTVAARTNRYGKDRLYGMGRPLRQGQTSTARTEHYGKDSAAARTERCCKDRVLRQEQSAAAKTGGGIAKIALALSTLGAAFDVTISRGVLLFGRRS